MQNLYTKTDSKPTNAYIFETSKVCTFSIAREKIQKFHVYLCNCLHITIFQHRIIIINVRVRTVNCQIVDEHVILFLENNIYLIHERPE